MRWVTSFAFVFTIRYIVHVYLGRPGVAPSRQKKISPAPTLTQRQGVLHPTSKKILKTRSTQQPPLSARDTTNIPFKARQVCIAQQPECMQNSWLII